LRTPYEKKLKRKFTPISFVNEHTVEYSMVFYITELLNEKFKKVIPFYFWRSREGSKISLETVDLSRKFFLIAVYARRPKLFGHENEIIIKFSDPLFPMADFFKKSRYLNFRCNPTG